MTQITINQIANAFVPAKEITDAKLFAGRQPQINDALFAQLVRATRYNLQGLVHVCHVFLR